MEYTDGYVFLLYLIGGFFVICITARLIEYFYDYYKTVRFIKMEMGRADSPEEFEYWRRELKIARICIIPFVYYEFAARIVDFFTKNNKKD